ncbi:MAG: hypothetical protein GF317_10460 [Candidatus Lokiarchaeota archaeon]|nr:hypothetical protein [Candidatus Lokiarchaeota archaeon]MBD3200082.1 hypothetical protein [Candidatus Lokiarchaeota archaeon]
MNDRDINDALRQHFSDETQVEVYKGRGAQGIKYNGKMFIMFYKGDLVIKLSPGRIKELIDSGKDLPFDPGTGKPMEDRLLIKASNKDSWISLSEESKSYVVSL